LKTRAVSDIKSESALRTISLNRIEDTISAAATTGRFLSDELKNLAGIYRVDYVFINAQNDDVFIAGPAGCWRINTSGRVVNIESGLPTLQLDDLIVSLINAFNDDGKFGCTIEPRPSALESAQKSLAATSEMATGGFAEDFSRHVRRMAEKHPVFASLKNVFDLALVANIVKKYDVRNRLQWQRRLGDGSVDNAASSYAPTQYVLASHEFNDEVDSIMNFESFDFKMSGRQFRRTIVGVSGGVEFDFNRLLEQLEIGDQSQSQFPQAILGKAPKRQSPNAAVAWWWD